MSVQVFHRDVSEADRARVITLTSAFFNAVAAAPRAERLKDLAPYTAALTAINHMDERTVPVVMHEIGYLAASKSQACGLVSQAFCTIGERAHLAFLKADNPTLSAQMQDDSALMFHLSHHSLPHDPEGGVAPKNSEDLRRAVTALYEDATIPSTKMLCNATLIVLGMRNKHQLISRFISVSGNRRSPKIEGRAGLYRTLNEEAGAALATLTCDRMGVN